MGGKTRIAKQLAAVIDEYREPGQPVWDAFCGGLSMSVALSKKGPVYSTDACAPLIALYKAVQAGWDPPTEVSRETWQAAKSLPDSDPMKAFCAFGCSFGGNWAGGYAEDKKGTRNRDGTPSNYALSTSRKLKTEINDSHIFDCIDFLTIAPADTEKKLYLDPPYQGKTSYKSVKLFNHLKFEEHVRSWSKYTDVFVSGYDFPLGQIIWEGPSTTTLSVSKSDRLVARERLYYIAKGSLL